MVRSTNDTPYDFLQIAGDELVSLAFELKVRWFYFLLLPWPWGLFWVFVQIPIRLSVTFWQTHFYLFNQKVPNSFARSFTYCFYSVTKMPFMHVLIYLHIYYWLKIKCSNHIELPTPLRVWRHQIDQQNKSSRLCLCKLYHLKHNVQDEKNTGTVKRYGNSLMDPKSSIITLQLFLFFFIVCVYACSLSHFLCSVQLVIEEFI